jgi:RHS repeat-associated protein
MKIQHFVAALISLTLSFFTVNSLLASSQPYITDHGINFGTGNKYHTETDVSFSGPVNSLTFERTYNSQSTEIGILGYGWSISFGEKLELGSLPVKIILVQADGRHVHFADDGAGSWINETGKIHTIIPTPEGYQLTMLDGATKLYDSAGKLTEKRDSNNNSIYFDYNIENKLESISDDFGHSVTLSYNQTSGYLQTLSTPIGNFTYEQDLFGNLEFVHKPDGTVRQYIYNDPNGDVHNLTGIKDETGVTILTVTYDTDDRAVTSAKANGMEGVTIEYLPDLQRTITDSRGTVSTYQLEARNGIVLVSSFTGPGCSSCGENTNAYYSYNDRNQVTQVINDIPNVDPDPPDVPGEADGNDIVTQYGYDGDGNRSSTTEAFGTADQRTITRVYEPDSSRVSTVTRDSVANPGQQTVTTTIYDGPNPQSVTETGYNGTTAISRTTTYSYDDKGRVEWIDGPRTDVLDKTIYSYYPDTPDQGDNQGQLHTVTNAMGHITTYGNYNVHGKPELITPPAGDPIILGYDGFGRIQTRARGSIQTSYQYYDNGSLHTLTHPGYGTITYTYTDSGKPETVTDNLGNSMTYIYETYETSGKPERVEYRDPAGQLRHFIEYLYEETNDLDQTILADGSTQDFDYDPVGNLKYTYNSTLGSDKKTEYIYDALNRLKDKIEPGAIITSYEYDSHDNIKSITDAESKTTNFTYDDFGRVLTQISPDTGTTTFTYDDATGQMTQTYADGTVIVSSFDALGRITSKTFPDSSQNISFGYDENADGVGKITSVADPSGTITYSYNAQEQLDGQSKVVDNVTYPVAYGFSNTTGNLDSMTYPSGLNLTYQYNGAGQITGIQADSQPLIENITYLPFGGVEDYTFSSISQAHDQTYDLRYMIDQIQSGSMMYDYTVNGLGNVETVDGKSYPDLTADTTNFDYLAGTSKLDIVTDSQGPKQYVYDDNGNITSDGILTFIYDQQNHLDQVKQDTTVLADYVYDGFNRRIKKIAGGNTTVYHYDRNSLLIAETLADGTPLVDYIYLGSTMVALKKYGAQAGIYYVVNDHLTTPQMVLDAAGTVVWQAACAPYGLADVTVNTITFNIRFPGQYFDSETGLHYNWNRYYDPATGRYITADPIGLEGGMNLYAYVGGDPVNGMDPEGLSPTDLAKCFYYSIKVDKLQEKCKEEMGCTDEEILNFCDKYGGGAPSHCIMNCVKAKDPDLYAKWTYTCAKSPYRSPGKPVPK